MFHFWCKGIAAIILSAVLLTSQMALANSENETEKERPVIAVVLAGGGAKGAAHIGVLKALEEMHIPVDIITGTSMGAFVGGMYATGMSADEIESFIHTIDWSSGYRDRVNRDQLPVREKQYYDRYQIQTDLGLRFGDVTAPKGVVQGQNMHRILREAAGNIPPMYSFDELAVRYRAVATDIVKLEPVVLDSGYLTDAMMASMSVPGALPPFPMGEKLLVDGGVTNNMPVELAREMGADLIIAVDISTDYQSRHELKTFINVGDQLSNYMVQRSTHRQSKKLTDNDVLLSPKVGDMSTTDFSRMPDAYELGYIAATESKEALQRFATSPIQYQAYINRKQDARRSIVYGDQLIVDEIEIINNSHYNDNVLKQFLSLEPGKRYTLDELETRVHSLYSLNRFEQVLYRYDQDDKGKTTLYVEVNEKEWGPNYVDFRFYLEDDFQNTSQYSIGLSVNFTDLNDKGAEIRTNLEMGSDKLIEAEWYSPIFNEQKLFTSASMTYVNENRQLPFDEDFLKEVTLAGSKDFLPINYVQFTAEAALGIAPSFNHEFKFGARYTVGDFSLSSLPKFGTQNFNRKGLFARYRYDTFDDMSFPAEGNLAHFELLASEDNIQEDQKETYTKDRVNEVTIQLGTAHSYQRHTLVGMAEYEVTRSRNATIPIMPKSLGGFLNLSGLSGNSLIGQNKIFGSLVYRYRWFDNDFGLFRSPVYLGASAEHGGVWSDPNLKISEAPMYVAGSVFAGVKSPIGPIILAYGQTEERFSSVYLIVGTAF
ncbi:Putative outer membrane lysophospholipase patatin-like [Vibrio nigripulchritudo SOn1]|uniref:Outer membrane lysophospholipase patatin-like n=2 Tax=Vibrio nigripulchritudo TaxID=28173 RepID=A0AAV2VPJ0_9VIBR|nr:patatin-like phospholipase family protein [Vibrio nigripulchritudo]CCO46448.1 Putative outer membrane lysophospholipase patatin-like [Vibrio nigripulchritudo SOn1]